MQSHIILSFLDLHDLIFVLFDVALGSSIGEVVCCRDFMVEIFWVRAEYFYNVALSENCNNDQY
jgi:hypothetical protein